MSIILTILLSSPVDSQGAPSIKSLSGVIADEELITITGSGFGSHGPNVLLFDDFEKGTNGNKISTGLGIAQVGKWSHIQSNCDDSDARYPVYTSEWRHSGLNSMKSDWATSIRCQEPAILMRLDFPGTTEVFYSFWTMVPVGKNVPGDQKNGRNPIGPNWKLSWLFNAPFGNDHMNDYVSAVVLQENLGTGYTGWLCSNDHSPARETGGELGDHMTKGEWSRFDIYHRGGVSDGILAGFQIDSSHGIVQKVNKINVFTLENGYEWNTLTIPGYGRGYTQNAVTLYDDVYVATGPGARARVEIGNLPTYTKCLNIAIATVSTWSHDRVTAIIRQGSFTHGQKAFLYVIDASGAVNARGYPITIGAH